MSKRGPCRILFLRLLLLEFHRKAFQELSCAKLGLRLQRGHALHLCLLRGSRKPPKSPKPSSLDPRLPSSTLQPPEPETKALIRNRSNLCASAMLQHARAKASRNRRPTQLVLYSVAAGSWARGHPQTPSPTREGRTWRRVLP